MAKKKQVLYPVVFMIVITAIFTTALALINELTIDRIKALEDTKQKQTILYVFGIEAPDNQADVNKAFNQYIETEVKDNETIYKATQDGTELGYAFEITGSGLWGSILGYAAVNQDFTQVLGIDFVTHSETPGLGGRISELWFKEQFRAVEIDPEKKDIVTYRPAPKGNVDAITGATLTSDAVRNIINEDIMSFINRMEGGL